jgi:hypothetical protein
MELLRKWLLLKRWPNLNGSAAIGEFCRCKRGCDS